MQIFQALLLALWAGLCAWDQFGPHLGFRKPLLASLGVGIILGDMTTAIMIGATMEMMWLGVNNIGAYVPPDVISGTIVGASLGIMSGGSTESAISMAVAIGIPTATLVQQLNMLVMTTNVSLVHAADKAAESGKFSSINKYFWLGAICFFLSRAIPTFIAVGAGSAVIDSIMAFLQNIRKGGVEYRLLNWYVPLGFVGLLAGIMVIGTVPAVIVFEILWCRFYEKLSWKVTIIATIFCLIMVVPIFTWWLTVDFPIGIIGNLIMGY